MRCLILACCPALLLTPACSANDGSDVNGGGPIDASLIDASVDVAADASLDGATDSSVDSTPDGPVDVTAETDASSSCVGVACSDHGTCVIVAGTATCDCEPGFYANGLACVPDGCILVEEPELVPLAPLEGENPSGRSEAIIEGSFHDEYLYDATDLLKVGVRREWGGTITFFGMAAGGLGRNATNVIDANDTGREVQVAFYDPDRHMQNCAWDAACLSRPSECPTSITYLGWNPVQGGNRCNIGSGVDWLTNQSGTIELATTPLHWNPNWDFPDCSSSGCNDPALRKRRSEVQVVQTLRFVRTHVVELTYQVTNLADMDHAPTLQEMPTIYTANGTGGTPDLWRLFDSTLTHIPIDTPAGNDGFFYENFDSPGGWVSLQNDDSTYGVGVLYENQITTFQGWQLRSLPFNNFRARFTFGIPSLAAVYARAYLVLGSLANVRSEAEWLTANLAPFGGLDSPVADEEISGQKLVQGWALDNLGIAAVELWIDGNLAIPLTYGEPRDDVCRVWPGYRGCNNVGYGGTFDFSTLSSCQHLLEIRATDTSGNTRTIARRRISVPA